MILSIIKKVTAIYKVNNKLIFILCVIVSCETYAQADLSSYCFTQTTNLNEVQSTLAPFLLPKDIISQRKNGDDNCIDIVLSPDRAKLFEKFLRKRYVLKELNITAEKTPCRLSFKTTKKRKAEETTFKIGEKNNLNLADLNKNEVSTMELLISEDKSSELSVGDNSLTVECRLIGDDKANVAFRYSSLMNASLNTEVLLKKGEWLNVATVVNELNEKKKTLGIPQIENSKVEGKNETLYELQFN